MSRMSKRMAKAFFNDVINALDEYFEECFWDIETEISYSEATIHITVNIDEVSDYMDDPCGEIFNATEDINWEYDSYWDLNTYTITIANLE